VADNLEELMKLKGRLLGLVLIVAALAFPSLGDDGMWMPHQMKGLNLKALGLQMNPENLYKKDGTGLMSAVVNLGGGTGEFVSPEGLILTNHHVAFGAIQRASSQDRDYIKNGFLAATKAEEIPAQGYNADILLGYEDVTAKVLAGLKPKMTPRQRYDALDKVTKELVTLAEKGGRDLRCSIGSMYSGNQYYLFSYKRIKDVRLVLAPPQDLGNFGGETDNWMWPRHTCDFSFLRAYVAKDGTGADYSADNVPYRPKSICKISLEGVAPDELTFVMGYPGTTYRNYTLAEFRLNMDAMGRRIKDSEESIAFFEAAGRSNKEVEIRYASRVKGLYNGLKNYQGKLEGMTKYGLLDKKAAQEKTFLDWVAASPERQKKYGAVVDALAAFLKSNGAFTDRSARLNAVTGGSTLLGQALTIVQAVSEFQKPDKDREPQFQERNKAQIKAGIPLAERGYVLETDKAYFKFTLKKLLAVPADQIPAALKSIAGQSEAYIDGFVDGLYEHSALADPKKRLEMLDMKPAELAKLNDSLIKLAAALEPELRVVREEAKGRGQERADLEKAYQEAVLIWKGDNFAPDANGTIRFTFGPVLGYAPKDAVYYLPQTTLKGVLEKDTGVFPFAVPEKIKALAAAKDFGPYKDARLGTVPACFLNTTNVTGGNSGSPTFNAKGEQVGIIFDMTYESVIGDYFIIPEFQRSISVDIRYVLFVTEKFCGATHLIREIGL
jgi:hypothetical protein